VASTKLLTKDFSNQIFISKINKDWKK